MTTGKLYIVSTPIGNYGDMTFRAVETLKNCDLIACEDTRRTGLLMKEFDIETNLTSYHDHNKNYRSDQILQKVLNGQNVAIVSDAGTPCISDPGFVIVRAARDKDIEVVGVPGATAAINAIAVSGMPTDKFVFEGFLPHKKGRKSRLEAIKDEERTLILYESVHRIIKTMEQLKLYFSDRKVAVLREMTKTYEEFISGTFDEVISHLGESDPKGEFVIVIEAKKTEKRVKVNKYKDIEN
ncbi:MAG: 16S rRNA (cytidine(1402)-2'-O)-methyltransferase [Candidatus Delongbacteria bacterium]|jgi:16S rRNA (cytidine1402-2'-O)-methyltransferase|nr:16S rRNA (cytidine(1402)-2'-O)-methyltransferase [Candidatus Delongbacteria bacterium]